MEKNKLSCLIEGYAGTYFEVGQIWETRDENIKARIIRTSTSENYPIICEYQDSFEDKIFESTVDIHGKHNKSSKHRLDLTKLISTEKIEKYLRKLEAYIQ